MKKMIHRIMAGIVLIFMVTSILLYPQTTYSATANKSKELEKSLEKKYGITITLSSELSKDDSVAYKNLLLLRDALYMIPDNLTAALVKHFKSKGKSTTIVLSLTSAKKYGTYAGTYNYDSNKINLYIPKGTSMWGSGMDSKAIIHEFGHMVENALSSIYGSKKLKSEFTALNGKKSYGGAWKDGYELYFVYDYALTSFSEDFAETFMASLDRYNFIHSAYNEKKDAPLVKKSEYIKEMIESKLKAKITNDDWRIYPQTPSQKYMGTGKSKLVYEGTYQYKIKKAAFSLELRNIWKDITVYKKGWSSFIPMDEFNDYKKAVKLADEEYLKFFEKYDTNMTGKIKRKDVALIFSDVMKHFSIIGEANTIPILSDCDDLGKNYKNAIKKVVGAGLMLESNDKFSPESYCTYEQAYYAFMQLYVKEEE